MFVGLRTKNAHFRSARLKLLAKLQVVKRNLAPGSSAAHRKIFRIHFPVIAGRKSFGCSLFFVRHFRVNELVNFIQENGFALFCSR